jgi:hypothetical protein
VCHHEHVDRGFAGFDAGAVLFQSFGQGWTGIG